MAHVLSNRISLNDWQRHATAHPIIGQLPSVVEHPVCPRCERVMVRGNGKKGSWSKDRIGNCLSCGYYGKTTLVFREYIQEELYRR